MDDIIWLYSVWYVWFTAKWFLCSHWYLFVWQIAKPEGGIMQLERLQIWSSVEEEWLRRLWNQGKDSLNSLYIYQCLYWHYTLENLVRLFYCCLCTTEKRQLLPSPGNIYQVVYLYQYFYTCPKLSFFRRKFGFIKIDIDEQG